MPTFVAPSSPSSEGAKSPRSLETSSEKSFQTAQGERNRYSSEKGKGNNITQMEGQDNAIDERNRPTTVYETRELIKKLEERDVETRQEMDALRIEMRQMMSVIMNLSLKQKDEVIPEVAGPSFIQTPKLVKQPENPQKLKELKWPAAYDHSNPSEWRTTHSLLKYIYKRDVVEKGLLQPSDFFMQLFSQAVTGTDKELIMGQFEEMVIEGETSDALGLLTKMDELYKDRNAKQTAANLLHSCKQFKDESLSSFLPRFQKLLTRSPSSARDDKGKTIYLKNALNQATKTFMVGRIEPDGFNDLIKYLSKMGSQMEEVAHLKTRIYHNGQIGTFDDGTRGIAGGKLLGRNSSFSPLHPALNIPDNIIDSDGDTKMTGVNKIHAKWVSKKELERRKIEGECIRCGKKGHLIQRCNFLPAIPREVNIKTSIINEQEFDSDNEEESLKE